MNKPKLSEKDGLIYDTKLNCWVEIQPKLINWEDRYDLPRGAPNEFTNDSGASYQSDAKCHCGVDSLGEGRHSDYCPKYKEEV